MSRYVIALALLMVAPLAAQSPRYGVGHAASPELIAERDITVLPDGSGLPPGSGTAADGAQIYERRCRECHGPEGQGGDETGFIGKPADLTAQKPKKTVGSYWPYATTLWDYIHRAMPFKEPGTLSDEQVYAVTAYILHLNGLVGETDPVDAESLPKIMMPNREGFVGDPRPDAP